MQTIYLFGDSITAGYFANQEFTDELTKRVAAGFPDVTVVNAGIPGDTTIDGLARIEEHILKYEPSIVTVFFGANDAALYRLVGLEKYEENLRKMIQLIGPAKVVLVSPPYVSQKSHKLDRPLSHLEKFAKVTERLAAEYNLSYVDLLTAMKAEPAREELLQEDGLHFSVLGYDFLADLMNQGITKKI